MIKVASYLSESEMNRVKQGLEGLRIEHFISNKGTVLGQYHDQYFEVSVREADYVIAKSIVVKVTATAREESRTCPKCKASAYRVVEKMGFWEKIFYLGATCVQCKKCGTRYAM